MFYILWALLSLAVFFYFAYIVLVGGKLIREKLGLFATVIFVLGLLSFIGRSNNSNQQPNNDEVKKWTFGPADSLVSNQATVDNVLLESTPISKNIMGFVYAQDKRTHRNVPISAYAITTGFSIGTNWAPTSIQLDTTSNNHQFIYSVNGLTEWRLLGFTIASQYKTCNGVVNLK